jgi:excisionase family DNA binding protein
MSESGSFPAAHAGDSKEERTVKGEIQLTPFSVRPLTARQGGLEGSDPGSPDWPSPMPAPQASPQPQGRGTKPNGRQSAAGRREPLLTVGEFADELRVTRACVRKWILERRVSVVKIGRLVRLPASEIHRIIDEGSRPRAQRRQDTA